MKVNLKCT